MLGNRILRLAVVACTLSFVTAEGLSQQPLADPYAQRKAYYEELWQTKVERCLHFIEGVVVTVNVELTPESEKQIIHEEYGSSVIRSSRSMSSSINHKRDTDAQGPGRHGLPKHNGSNEAVEVVEEESDVPKTRIVSTIVGLTPAEVSVSISIPRNYALAVVVESKQRHETSRPQQEMVTETDLITAESRLAKHVKQSVAVLLPNNRENETSNIEVLFYDQVQSQQVVSEAERDDSTDSQVVDRKAKLLEAEVKRIAPSVEATVIGPGNKILVLSGEVTNPGLIRRLNELGEAKYQNVLNFVKVDE